MIWVTEEARKRNRKKKLFARAISTITVIALVASLIIFIPDSKPAKGASLFKTWTSYNDFNTNNSETAATTPQTQIVLNGSGNPTDAAAGTLQLGQSSTFGVMGSTTSVGSDLKQNTKRGIAYNSTDNEYMLTWAYKEDYGCGSSTCSYVATKSVRVSANGTILGTNDIHFQAYENNIAYNSTANNYLSVLGTGNNLNGQLLNTNGTISGSSFVISNASGNQINPEIVYNPSTDQYLVVWGDSRNNYGVYAQLVNANGTLSGSEIFISNGAYWQGRPGVAYNSTDNEYLVSWGDIRGAANYEIYAQRIDSNGALSGSDFLVTGADTGYDLGIDYNSADNQYLIAWSEGDNPNRNVFAQRVNANGTLSGAALTISNATGNQYSPNVAYNSSADNQFLVTFTDGSSGSNLYGQLVNGSGTLSGSNFDIDTGTSYAFYNPRSAYNSTDDQFMTFSDYQANSHSFTRTGKPFVSPGSIGGSGASDIGLRTDAGSGVKAKWSSVTFNSSTLSSGQGAKFAIRTSDDGSTWSALLGKDGAAIDWTTGTGNYLGQAYGESVNSAISGVSGSRYLEIVPRLESTGGDGTPTLNDVRLDYDVIDAPGSGDLSIYRNDGTTQIPVPDASGGWTNETTVKVKGDSLSGLSDSSTVALEVESKPVGTAFDGTGTTTGTAVAYSGSPVSAWTTLSGLSADQDYHIRVRLKDDLNRVSAWTNFNSNNTAFTVEQTAPTGSVSINGGAAYTTSTSATLDLSSATDPGAIASGVDKVMASEDPDFINATLGDTTWQNWPGDPSSVPFTLSSGDATKTIYVKFKDKAGNLSSDFTITDDLNGSPPTYKDVANTSAEWTNGSGEIKLKSSFNITWTYQSGWNVPDVGSYSGPAIADLDNDNDYDVLTVEWDNTNRAYKNTGTVSSPTWTYNSGWNPTTEGGANIDVSLADLDNDGDYDLLKSESLGVIRAYRNTGTVSSPVWTYNSGWNPPDIGTYAATALADLDNDNDLDLLIGEMGGVGHAYENTGTVSSPIWTDKNAWNTPDIGKTAFPDFADFDGDGDYDLLMGEYYGVSKGYENTGDNTSPIWIYNSNWNTPDIGKEVRPALADLDNDGDIDVLIGEQNGLTKGYSNTSSVDYQPANNIAQSITVDSVTQTISKATLTATQTLNGQTVDYQMSANGGSNWESVTTGVEHTFTNTGSDLRWKATLDGTTSASPVIQDINISYKIQESDSIVLDTTAPADVVETGGKTSVGFTDNTTTTEIADNTWTQDLTPYFSWGPSSDPDPGDASQSGVSGYNVYFGTNASATAEVDGSFQAGTTYDPSVSYAPAIANSGNLPSGDQYYLKIIAKDTAGNFSAGSKDYTVKVDNTAPDVTSTAVSATTTYSNKVQVSWVKPPDDSDDVTGGGAVKYYVYWCLRDAGNGDPEPTITCYSETDIATAGRYEQTMAPDAIADITNTSFNDYSSDASYTYYFGIRAIDSANNMSTSVSPIGGPGYISDTTPPSVPSSVSASALTGTSIQVNWTAASDNTGIAGYQVWYTTNSGVSTFPGDYTLAGSTSNTTYTQSGLVDYKEYYYRVRAYDGDTNYGNINDPATNPSPAFARTPDVTNPPAISWVTANGANGYSATQNDLDWTAPTDLANDGTSPGSGISGYNVYVSDQGYNANTFATVGDLPSPTFDVTPVNGGSLEASTSISDTGLDPFMWYAYKIVAYDSAGTPNASADSSTVWVRTKKDTQPVGASSLALTTPAGDPSSVPGVGTEITISFNGGASKNDSLDLYEIYRATTDYGADDNQWLINAVKVKIFTSTDMAPVTSGLISTVMYNDNDTAVGYNFTDTGLNDNTVYYYKVRVVDTIAGEGTFYSWTNTAANQETADISAPTAPASLAVTDLHPLGTIAEIQTYPILMAYWPHINERIGNGSVSTDETFVEYRLYRSTDINFTAGEIVYQGTDNFYRDEISSAQSNQGYYYKITSADGTNNGGVNNESMADGPVYGPINPSTLDKIAPSILTRSETVNASSATINLGLDESSEAKILFGSGATCSNLARSVGTAVDTSAPSVELKKLSPNSTYSYRVITIDSNDNKRTSTCYSFPTPSFILNSIEESVSVSAATLKWKANASANSFVKFTNTKTGATKTVANSDIRGAASKHSLGLSRLAAGTKYSYQLISMDEYSNKAVTSGSFTTAKFKATSVSVSTTVSSAIVTWKTNVKGTSLVKFGPKSIEEYTASEDEDGKTHRVVIRGLKPGTKYKFRVKSKDAHDNIAIKANSGSSFTTKPFTISGKRVRVSTNSATVTWTTNARSTSSVEYRSASDKVSQLSGDARFTTKHSVVIKNLEDDTPYSYRIKSRDKEDNIAESKMLSFKTNSLEREYDVNPKVSDIDEMELSATSAKIAWTTAGETSSWVDYGTSRSLSKSAGNDTMTVDHIVELTNLTPGMLYYYRVRGEDEAGNKYQSGVLTFTALVEPKIVEEAKVKPSNDSAVITWKTNTDTDSIVEYGLTDKYGDSSGSGALAKEHEVKIEGLAQDTTYHFRVGGVDKYSVKVMSEDSTFKTSKDTVGPKIDDIRSETLRSRDAEGKEKISVIVNFTTNEEATSYVEYAEGITMATYNKKTRLNNTLNLSHSALIEGLKPATTYHYRIVTKDRYGNTTKSMDKTILTPKESETVLQKIIKILEETFGWVSNLRDYLNKKVNSFRK